MSTAVVAFVVVEEYTVPTTKSIGYRHLSRRYHVKEAAEQFAHMARGAGHPKCYVKDVYGDAEAPDPDKRSKK